MSELSYNDHCRITRMTGSYDSYGNPGVESVYEGACDFQPGGQTALSIITHNDTVYLPAAVLVAENDIIEVTPLYGFRRGGIVKLAHVLPLDITDELVTEIEIKQSTEKND